MFNRFMASVWIPLKQNLTRAFALSENKHRGVSSLRRGGVCDDRVYVPVPPSPTRMSLNVGTFDGGAAIFDCVFSLYGRRVLMF